MNTTSNNLIKMGSRFLLPLLVAATGLWLAIALASLWLLTLGTDEAWVLNGLRSALEPPVPNLSSDLIFSSGGLFAIGNLIIEYVFGSQVWLHRLFSLLCFLALLGIIIWSRRYPAVPYRSSSSGLAPSLLLIAPLLAVPGTAEISSMALGGATALFLLILACVLWCRHDRPGIGDAILCGCLCGLAAASRFELILAVPAFLLLGAWQRRDQGWRVLLPEKTDLLLVMMVVAIVTANMALMGKLGNHQQWAGATGTSTMLAFMDYPRQLTKILIGQSFVPFGVLAFLTVLPFWHASANPKAQNSTQRLAILLLIIAWILALGWFLQAPIPHLRYLWPALICFAIPAGIVLKSTYDEAVSDNNTWRRTGCLLIAIALVLGGAGGSFRSLVMGEQDYISWEWSREIRADYFRRFQHVQDQRNAADFIRQLPENAVITCYIQPFPLRYLTRRPVMLLSQYVKEQQSYPGRLYLVLSPGVGLYSHLPPKAYVWLEEHGLLQAQFGHYSIYELPPELLSSAPDQLRTKSREYTGHPLSDAWFGRH